MDIYNAHTIGQHIAGNPYVGRGIVTGCSADGKNAVLAYFIMGRSSNSRNRVFVKTEDGIRTEAFDHGKLEDPSLIIYSPVRRYGDSIIVTNGDQTDTIYEALAAGGTFESALETRAFEPDAPNYTPRISGLLSLGGEKGFGYKLSILKSMDAVGSECARYCFSYRSVSGLGHFIHTYITDGSPLPSFTGEPERVFIPDSIDKLTDDIWNNLDEDNKISLYVAYLELESGKSEYRLINNNQH